MKNKKHIYFLIPAVALVWGLIIYKVISGVSSGDPSNQQINKVVASDVIEVKPNEPYTLALNYDDPFGKISKTTVKKTTRTKVSTAKKPAKKVEKPEIDLSKYKYQGMIQNAGSKQKIALVSVNNEIKMVKEGDLIDEYKVVEIKKDAIQMKLNKGKVYLYASK